MGVLFRSFARVRESQCKGKIKGIAPYNAGAAGDARLQCLDFKGACDKAAAGLAAQRLQAAFVTG
jgi:hypothetical protein